MLARVLLVAVSFYGLGFCVMLIQRRNRTGTTKTKWTKYLSYGLFLAVGLLVGRLGGVVFACTVLVALGTALTELFRAATLGARSSASLLATVPTTPRMEPTHSTVRLADHCDFSPLWRTLLVRHAAARGEPPRHLQVNPCACQGAGRQLKASFRNPRRFRPQRKQTYQTNANVH